MGLEKAYVDIGLPFLLHLEKCSPMTESHTHGSSSSLFCNATNAIGQVAEGTLCNQSKISFSGRDKDGSDCNQDRYLQEY